MIWAIGVGISLWLIGCSCPLATASLGAQQPLNGHERETTAGDEHINGKVGTSGFEDYVKAVMDGWHVPGVAVAVVDGNETWAKGFGHAILPSTPVTPHTLFFAGSTTKSFTAAAISQLVDNSSDYSNIQWTTPIASLLREDFVLSDPWATEHITIEDALSHRTGYPRHDLAFAKTTKDSIRKLRYLSMAAEPRTKYLYCNKMFGVLGYLVETLSKLSLGDYFRRYLWGPIGMQETFLGLKEAENSGLLLADEYYFDNSTGKGKYVSLPHSPESVEEGAGAIVTNVLDYAKYLRMMMDESAPLSKDGHREIKTPRSFSRLSQPPFVGPVTYGFGWNLGVFEGEEVWLHNGQITMFVSIMLIVPKRKFGIVVFANSAGPLPDLVAFRALYDRFGVPKKRRVDLEAIYKEQTRAAKEYLDTCPERLYPHLPDQRLPPSLPLANHTGEFRDPGYGTLKVYHDCGEGNTSLKPSDDCEFGVRYGVDSSLSLKAKLRLEHKSGNYWVGKASVVTSDGTEVSWLCMRAEFRIDVGGAVSSIGLDVRQEGEDGPLVWFSRVEQ